MNFSVRTNYKITETNNIRFKVRIVNLAQFALCLEGTANQASPYRKLQRFFAKFDF